MEQVIEIVSSANTRSIMLVSVCFVLYLVENGIPYRTNKRSHLLSNIVLTVSTALLYFMTSALTIYLLEWACENNFGLFRTIHISALQILIISIFLLDFWAAYVSHIMMHYVPFLWKFHQVHHTDTMIDVTTAIRQHPVETLFRIFFQTSGAFLLGIPFWVFGIYLLLSTTNAQIEHANITLPASLEKFLRYFYVTPNTHKVHHSKKLVETNSNYGNIFSVWDRIFKTYKVLPQPENIEYGLEIPADEKSSNNLKNLFTADFGNKSKNM